MSDQMRAEFEAWECDADQGPQSDPVWLMYDPKTNKYPLNMIQRRWETWQASSISAQATIANQAQMIEHLRGGPTPGYTAVDMTTAAAQGFRDGVASKEKIIDALLNHCDDGECYVCGQIICPHGEPLHFHHDGCPACAQDEPA